MPRVSNTEPLTLREGNKFIVFENRMPSGVTGWRKLNNEGLQGQAKEKDMGKGTRSKRRETRKPGGNRPLERAVRMFELVLKLMFKMDCGKWSGFMRLRTVVYVFKLRLS
jgi:hypothetical protein